MEINYTNVVQCDKCNNSGLLMWRDKETGEVMGKQCDCHNQRLTLLNLEKSGLKNSVQQFTFERFTRDQPFQKAMYEMCQKFTHQDKQKFLYISGQPGCGKTHIGTATCRVYIYRHLPTLYVTYLTLMNDMKAKVNEDDYNAVLQRYASIDVLYIDDFMKHDPSKADIAHSFELINLRVVADRITIITSERSLEDITEIDEALGGRIKQRCGEFVMNIARAPGRDWRLRE